MKEEYYIQGDPTRAEEIKAAFEAKGCTLYRLASNCDSEDLIYYSLNGKVRGIKKDNLYLFEAHPGYKKLELPVEPKFKVGGWIVRGEGFVYEPSLITEIRGYYICELINGERVTYTLNDVHNNFHLWTITDAKDGDVLATDNGWTCIFKAFDGCVFSSYCFMDSEKWFFAFGSEAHTLDSRMNGNIHPATEEQRELLFKKMREAGYEWDSKKKVLRKIIEPKFKVGDWIIHNNGSSAIPIQVYNLKKDRYLVTNMLSSKGEVMLIYQDKWHLWTITDAKDGDVLALNGKPFIYSSHKYGKNYCYIDDCGQFRASFNLVLEGNCVCPATKEQRDLLSKKIRETGYEWDEKKKELRKIKPHYDIAYFQPKQWVLVRNSDNQVWGLSMFSHRDMGFYICINREDFRQCIPFDGNETLLGTTDPCDECYVNW